MGSIGARGQSLEIARGRYQYAGIGPHRCRRLQAVRHQMCVGTELQDKQVMHTTVGFDELQREGRGGKWKSWRLSLRVVVRNRFRERMCCRWAASR